MPRLNENTEHQLHELEHGARTKTLEAWNSFSNFALRDNVLEVAVGLMQGPLFLVSSSLGVLFVIESYDSSSTDVP